ncbi:MAG: ABC transporter ATP-binding protein [Actinobacteria bacterium]|nr:ABC transporter ATP-binding protein [Actinomycetota bacterium]
MSLVAESVRVTYPGPPPVEAVHGVSLRVDPAEFVTIIGPSGSGKSSLLHVLGALMAPSLGRVLIDGVDVGALSERARNSLRAHRLGFVFQEFHLIDHRTVLDNVAVGSLYQRRSLRRRRRDALDVIHEVGLDRFAHTTPRNLSGGERQRVGIARALIGKPSILLCDEPTGNLDSATTTAVVSLLDRLRRDSSLSVIVVTHDLTVQQASDRSIWLRDGTGIAQP